MTVQARSRWWRCAPAPGAWLVLSLLALIVTGPACHRIEPRPQALLATLQAVPRGSATPGRIRVAGSERDAVTTTQETSWEVVLSPAAGALLELSVAPAGDLEQPCQAVAELLGTGRRQPLLTTGIEPSAGWQTIRRQLPAAGETTLRLTSTGPVAWADLYLSYPDRPRPADLPPNIVLIIIDTLRADHLSCYGYPQPTSPNLDRLAAESYRFTSCLSSSTWTLPSTATLLTGLLPSQHGLRRSTDRLTEQHRTAAEQLAEAGYRTVAFTDGGFLGFRWGFAQGFNRYDCTAGQAWEPKDVARIAAAARGWLDPRAYQPFFLLVHTYETHTPYTYHQQLSDRFMTPGALRDGDQVEAWDLARHPDQPGLRQQVVGLYDGEIRRADLYLGELLDELRATGLWQQTAVLLTSDHGEEFLEHGGVEHGLGKVFDENLRVPLLLKPPAPTAGTTIAVPVSGADVAATLLDLAGLEPGSSGVGRPLTRLVENGNLDRRILVHGLSSFPGAGEQRFRLDQGRHTAVYDCKRDHVALYDHDNDPQLQRLLPLCLDGEAGALLQRLQLVHAAAASPAGRLLTRLPWSSGVLDLPAASPVRLRGVWQGMHWRDLDGPPPYRLQGSLPSLLVLDLAAAPGPAELLLAGDGTGGEPRPLQPAAVAGDALTAAVVDELPEPLQLLALPAADGARSTALDEEERRELEALGYLTGTGDEQSGPRF